MRERIAHSHLIAKTFFLNSRKALDELPLSPLERVIHPQIQITSAASMIRLEQEYLCSAYRHFDLRPCAIRYKDDVFSYKKLHEKFKGRGLLHDLNIDAMTSADYVRLCLARAEQYRQRHLSVFFHESVRMEDLPLGPLTAIEFKNDYALERIANGMHIDSKCVVCESQIKPNESVLFTCKCCIVQCKRCVTLAIGLRTDTYREEPVGIKCPICRQNSYGTVTNAEKAINDENILVSQAMRRMYPESKNPAGILFKSMGSSSSSGSAFSFSNSRDSYRILDEMLKKMMFEALENDLHLVQTDDEEQLHSAKDDQNLVRCGIARLEV